MALTDEQHGRVRSEIGDATPPEDYELDAIHDRVGTVAGTALEVLDKRLAELLASPGRIGSSGDSIDNSTNMAVLERKIARLRVEHNAELVAAAGDELPEQPLAFDVAVPPGGGRRVSTWPAGWHR